jgi:hypothetical protein
MAAEPVGEEMPLRRATARRERRRRSRQVEPRPHLVKVKLSDAERLALEARAIRIGVSVPRLLVEAALAGSAQTLTERRALLGELFGARRLVAALGNNVNQLARVANSTGRVPEELAAAAGAVVRVTARLDAAVRDLSEGQR